MVLCEGGPTLNGQLLAHGLVDEACVTVAPLLAGGTSSRMISGPAPELPATMRLMRLIEADATLLARYVRAELKAAAAPTGAQCCLGSVALSRRTSRWKSAASSKPL